MQVRPFLVYLRMDLEKYDAIIFDLGGVLINLNYQLTIDAFKDLGVKELNLAYSQTKQTTLFDDYETGKISTQQFINTIKNYVPSSITPNQIVHAWNAMILKFPMENLKVLEQLSERKKLYLLSNTNAIHLQKVEQRLAQQNSKKLSAYFLKTYYSHELGMRKPHAEVFQFLCDDAEINPSKTLFIDDSVQHLIGAESIGLNTQLWEQNASLTKLMNF